LPILRLAGKASTRRRPVNSALGPTDKAMANLPIVELQRIYAALGRCLWHLQYVEDALNALLTVKHDVGGPGRYTENEARAMLAKRMRSTMGPAVKLAHDKLLLPQDTLNRLARLKIERNWVAHKVQRTVGDEVLSPWGRMELVRSLDKTTEDSQVMLEELITEMQRFVGSTGHEVVVPERLGVCAAEPGNS
jgi:hypothetical protein